jgi:hypothetical protein
MISDAEVLFWISAGIASLITIGAIWVLAKKNEMNYVRWIADGDWK